MLFFHYLATSTSTVAKQAGWMSATVVSTQDEQLACLPGRFALYHRQATPIKCFYDEDFLCCMTSIGKEVKYSKEWGPNVCTVSASSVKGRSTLLRHFKKGYKAPRLFSAKLRFTLELCTCCYYPK